MLTKQDVRDMVHALLVQQATDHLLRKLPDVYYGWVPPKTLADGTRVPGYWIGEADAKRAEWTLDHTRAMFDHAAAQLLACGPDDPRYDERSVAADEAALAYYAALRARDQVTETAERTIAARRDQLIARRVASRFYRLYQCATTFDWNLYHSAIPQDLRDYVRRQRARGPMSPTSLVLLYLVTQSTIEHGDEYQQAALTSEDHLVTNPLVTADLDIEAVEQEPSKQRRQYIRALQAQRAYDTKPPAHDNLDKRDVLADFEYHGLPEQLGALWIDTPDQACPHCNTPLAVKLIHAKRGFRYATVCSNYRTGCTCDPQSPIFSTRHEARDWAIVEWATTQAA